jgi:hypothetical protein
MFEGGYMGRLLRIDLSTRSYFVEAIEPEEYRLFLGGRGLGDGRSAGFNDQVAIDDEGPRNRALPLL